ncbi:MAG: phosphoribosylformylglycinamidine synthase, partial [Clostridia bacterium]|nr:phosphoribosylformylglycinamidine synthase [Clostridia bacterium]
MVYRIFVEKKEELAHEAHALLEEARTLLGLSRVTRIRLLNRYDVEGVDEALFAQAVRTVLSEPQLDLTYEALDAEGGAVFAVEYLPGQFDQRADSAAQCIQILSRRERPAVRSARVYVVYGEGLTDSDVAAIKHHVINPVEAREASLDTVSSLEMAYEIPESVPTLDGFITLDAKGLSELCAKMGFAMDEDDLAFCQAYFREEGRDPTVTELRMIDTYWSDHCRHTTFLTLIDEVTFEDDTLRAAWKSYLSARREVGREHKPINLMDVATIATRVLKKRGLLDKLDESEEINACTVKIDVTVDGKSEPWLLLFKNETHNHPTEIEPFGGAATCIGGAIRDPLSGRSYVYGAMRVTGAGNPLRPIAETRARRQAPRSPFFTLTGLKKGSTPCRFFQ